MFFVKIDFSCYLLLSQQEPTYISNVYLPFYTKLLTFPVYVLFYPNCFCI